MVREFLSRTPRHSRMTPPLTEGPALQQNGTVTKHRAMQKKHNSESDMKKSSVVCRQSSTPMTNKPEDHLLEKIASELYQGQESPLQLGDTRGLCESIEEDPLPVTNGVTTHNGDGSDVVSPTSAPWRLTSRSSYEELLTILETPGQEKHHLLSTTPQFRPKLETMAAHSESLPDKPGFLTVRPRPKNPPLSRDLHFKDFSRMSESYGYEGPPSPLMDTFNLLVVEDGSGVGGRGEEGEGAERRGSGSKGPRKWTRKTAIRRQRRKVGGSISEPPPDTSYSYRVSITIGRKCPL